MSEHKSVTEFLRQCIRYDESVRRRELEQTIAQILRDQRCVRRAVWLMGVLMLLAMVILGYAALFVDNFPHNTSQRLFHFIAAFGAGSLISLLTFAGLGVTYRRKLDQQREECRRLIAGLLESHLGKPASPGRGSASHDPNRRAVQCAAEADAYLQQPASLARG